MNYLELALQLINAASGLLPLIESDIAAGKAAAADGDPASLRARIAAAHEQSLAFTARLDALKDSAA
jgi:hypothetical protein